MGNCPDLSGLISLVIETPDLSTFSGLALPKGPVE
jgi:hypothetical protein